MRLHHLALAVRDREGSIAFHKRSSVRFRGPSGSRGGCGWAGGAQGRRERRVRGGDVAGTNQERQQGVDGVFSAFASSVAKWTGGHWASVVVAVLVVGGRV